MLPSAPGLAARLDGDRVMVTIDPGNPPSACRPTTVAIVLDDDNPDFPPVRETFQLHGLERQIIPFAIPPALQSTPKTAEATLAVAAGDDGHPAQVLITH
jgi:hypothetical protein